MTDRRRKQAQSFGGSWTLEKLGILERYLDAYTTALKSQPFKLMYIDAFAGTGRIAPTRDDDADRSWFVRGSARRAVQIENRPFDRLVFCEKDAARVAALEELRATHPERDIRVKSADANAWLSAMREDWRKWRGVLFLDPFGTEVAWQTIERIADVEALDTWILFPLSAVARMLPKSQRPEDVSGGWAHRLKKIYGDDSWMNLYRARSQGSLFGDIGQERDPGVRGLLEIYKNKLGTVFGERFLMQTRTLRNSKNSPMFELMLCVGHPKGIDLAKRIAKHILDKM